MSTDYRSTLCHFCDQPRGHSGPHTPDTATRLLTALEAAHVMRISLDQVHRLIADGDLIPVGVTLNGKNYYRERGDVDAAS